VFYYAGIFIGKTTNERRKSFTITICTILGLSTLLYFKYTNFFLISIKDFLENIGFQTNIHTLKIIVPVGISFYTFRLLSYLIEIGRGKIEPTNNFIAFAAYVAFFPSLLAGPIDRPNTFLPQLSESRRFDYALAVDGCRQILWGLVKKIVIADNCATYVNQAFDNYSGEAGSTLVIGAILFVFQVYADFSGYSDMAIGISKLLGIKVTQNFNYSLFAQNIADFWRRWHISLTTWLTDYVFMPLNVKWRAWGNGGMILAIIVNFVLCGLWHGDSWTFVVWGAYFGLLFIPLILSGKMFKKTRIETNSWGFPKFTTLRKMLLTFLLVTIGMVFFRADTMTQAIGYFAGIFDSSLLSKPLVIKQEYYIPLILKLIFFIVVEWYSRNEPHGLAKVGLNWNVWLRQTFYILLIFVVLLNIKGEASQFIYFKF
jgi:D-alanyl-lipoteichoic acid acyltransferase DltB (MBOAT superfamily)